MNKTKEKIISFFPKPISDWFRNIPFSNLQEIRFRTNRPICMYYAKDVYFMTPEGLSNKAGPGITGREIGEIATNFCNHSVYAYTEELKEGFITIPGGHRVGLAGKCVIKKGEIAGISSISGINIRIACQYLGCSKKLYEDLLERKAKNILLVGPPNCGKTTFLRDLIRLYSEKNKIAVVDERSEIGGSFCGEAQFNVGLQTDILDRYPKREGLLFALRALSPQILATDELGGDKDLYALKTVANAGCRIFATVHGEKENFFSKETKDLRSLFDTFVFLGRKEGVPCLLSIAQRGQEKND